jgi:hypothetical protein
MQIPWKDMLVQIHGAGMKWKGIGNELHTNADGPERFANDKGSLCITFDRGLWIVHLHRAICPAQFEKLAPVLKEHLAHELGRDAMKELLEAR